MCHGATLFAGFSRCKAKRIECPTKKGHFGGMKAATILLIAIIPALVSVAGCAILPRGADAQMNAPAGPTGPRPKPRPSSFAPPPPADATSAEDFDTTTTAERDAASAASADPSAEQALGQTIASLGSPAQPGFWLETPLVTARRPGRVVASNGESALVDLIPIQGESGAGSRLSLAALRLLGIGLTGLHEIQVFVR